MPIQDTIADRDTMTTGVTIGLATILAIVFVAHHPIAAGQDHSEILNDIVRKASIDRLVHGALIGIMGAFLFGFGGFAASLGPNRPLVRLGLIAYAAGCASTVCAALIDGFIAPDIAARFLTAPVEDARVAYDFLMISGSAIQYLTKLGLVLLSMGILSWSAALIRSAGPRRWIGLLGLASGGIPAALILIAETTMTPHSLIAVLAMQGIWNLAVAVLLMRGAHYLLDDESRGGVP
jgi:hypothetical protein